MGFVCFNVYLHHFQNKTGADNEQKIFDNEALIYILKTDI